jgi:integrase
MAPRIVAPAPGLYKNGSRLWVRTVRAPLSGLVPKSLSTGTADPRRANAVLATVRAMEANPTQYAWLAQALAGEITLDQLYTHHAAGTLHLLRDRLNNAARAADDPDLSPWVDRWIKDHLATLDIEESSRENYARQVRYFIPAGAPFPKTRLTEDYVKAQLAALTGARHDHSAKASTGTRRRYIAALQLFLKYARRRVPLENPIEGADWLPKNGSARAIYWEHDRRLAVLANLPGQAKAAMALVLGSGIELGALLAMKGAHVGSAEERTIVAPGSKNEYREERTIFVDQWAWDIFYPGVKGIKPDAPLWTYTDDGKFLRTLFYQAQVLAGLIPKPTVSPTTGKLEWSKVAPHTIHDGRHTYAINRALGLDGEEPQGVDFIAHNLGHADEQMVIRIYKKANVRDRLRLLQTRRAQQAAKAAGAK